MEGRPSVSTSLRNQQQWTPVSEVYGGLWHDIVGTFLLFSKISWRRQLNAWIFTPFYILHIIGALAIIQYLTSQTSFLFPASVVYLVVVFLGLLFVELVLGPRHSKKILKTFEAATGFLGRHMNIFFTPNFIIIPLSPRVHHGEVFRIIALFLLGYFAAMMFVAWSCRGMQKLFKTTRISETERATEMVQFAQDENADTRSLPPYSAQMRAEDSDKMLASEDYLDEDQPMMQSSPESRPYRWARFLKRRLDFLTFFSMFLFLGLPFYYGRDSAFWLYLSINVLSYLAANTIPNSWKRLFNPVLVTAGLTVLFIFLFGLTKHEGIHVSLAKYSRAAKYNVLLSGDVALADIGAGDILLSLLDASVVSFAFPMFKYRRDLRVHAFIIILLSIVLGFVSLTAYPAFAYAISIESHRAISFTSRSLASALAAPAVANLGGDQPTIVVLAIMSGILGALIGPKILDWLLIPEDDYVTRGVTLGMNSSAIVTAFLVKKDPRSAALSTLSFVSFGCFVVFLSSLPFVDHFVQRTVGLRP